MENGYSQNAESGVNVRASTGDQCCLERWTWNARVTAAAGTAANCTQHLTRLARNAQDTGDAQPAETET